MTQNTFTVNGSGNFATPGNCTLGHVPNSGEDDRDRSEWQWVRCREQYRNSSQHWDSD